jgi:hypothetical protein
MKVSVNETQSLPRLSVNKLWKDLLDAFDIEKGIVYTFYNLLIRPHKAIATYLFEDRSRLINPFRFLVISITIITFLLLKTQSFKDAISLQIDDLPQQAQKDSVDDETNKIVQLFSSKSNMVTLMVELVNDTFGISYFLFIPILALVSYISFPKNRLLLGEHIIVHTYLSGFWNFALVAYFPFLKLFPESLNLIFTIYALCYFSSLLFVYKSLSQWTWIKTVIYTLLTFSIGMMLFVGCYIVLLATNLIIKVYNIVSQT